MPHAFISPLTILLIAFALIVLMVIALLVIARFLDRRLAWIYRTNRRSKEYKRAKRGLGMGIDELCRRTGLDERTLRRATPRYREVTIAKRRGGERKLLVPDDATKAIQRTLLCTLLNKLRAHPAATGFESGRSIVDHARPHTGKPLVVTMDIKEFFSSTKAERIDAYFRRVGWDAEVAKTLTFWTTTQGGLPQGAPSSPRLSNLVNYYLDVQLTAVAKQKKAAYTRYADDIALSFKILPVRRRVRGTMQLVRRTLKVHGYQAHGKRKTQIQPRRRRQVVTGLVVNEKVNIPRTTRRRLRAVAHHLETGRPATMTAEQLQGWRAYQRMIETQRHLSREVEESA